MSALWVFSELVTALAAVFFLALGLGGSLFAYGVVGPAAFRRFRWPAEHRRTLRWLAPLVVLLSIGVLLFQFRDLRNSDSSPNHPAAGKAGVELLFAIEHRCPGLPEPER